MLLLKIKMYCEEIIKLDCSQCLSVAKVITDTQGVFYEGKSLISSGFKTCHQNAIIYWKINWYIPKNGVLSE